MLLQQPLSAPSLLLYRCFLNSFQYISKWKFTGSDGKPAVNEWKASYNPNANVAQGQEAFDWYRFDEAGYMITGWYTDETGNTYYMNPLEGNTQGKMLTGWIEIEGKYYYFNEISDGTRGKLLQNTVTPDGYRVDVNGARIN